MVSASRVANLRSVKSLLQRLRSQAAVLGVIVLAMWSLVLVDKFLPESARVSQFGIHPRSYWGLAGIPLAPLLHRDWPHLISNTVPFVVLGWLVLVRSPRDFFWVTALVTLLSGLGVWFLGDPATIHLGASGLIFGYFGFLLSRAYYERTAAALIIAALVVFLYGGLIWSVFSSQPDVSWEAHLCGFLSGIICGRIWGRRAAAQGS